MKREPISHLLTFLKHRTLFWSWLLLFFLSFSARAYQTSNRNCFSISVVSNRLIIHGSTNVNEFQCRYFEPIKDSLAIEVGNHGDFYSLHGITLKIKSDSFKCGNALMNHDFRKLLESDQHPYILVRLQEFRFLKDKTDDYIGEITGEFQLAGKTVTKSFKVKNEKEIAPDYFSGIADLNIRDFGLEPPTRMMNLVKVNEQISVEFLLTIKFLSEPDSMAALEKN